MTRDLILGTAGHIDHGKTALVKALTGVNTDRLPEEKARGITIDIGFARLVLDDYQLGIVDVPGHERFVKNMLAGATGIDLAMLVVAADDSVMPQTREHLEILRLLGLTNGVIALTKCDLVDQTTRDVATAEVRELVRGTFLADAQIVATSSATGAGIPQLKGAILEACQSLRPAATVSEPVTEPLRLAIDRSFIIQGHGTVVTGSVASGSVRVGDELDLLPGASTKSAALRVRVRALHNHDKPVEEVHRGMRAAVNLAGIAHEEVVRGHELASPGYLQASRVMTVSLKASDESRRPLRHRTHVRIHLGTAEVLAVISLLDRDDVQPGQWSLGQLFLERPAVAAWGQPFVIRESSAASTLGGGRVLQPTARKVRRRHIEVIEQLEKLAGNNVETRALAVAWFAGFVGFVAADLVRGAGVRPSEAEAVVGRLRAAGRITEVAMGPSRRLLLHADMLGELEERTLATVGKLHSQFPLLASLDRRRVQAQLVHFGDDLLVSAAVDRLLERRSLVGDDRRIARADFKPKLSANQLKLKERIVAAHRVAGFQPPPPESFANAAAGNAASLHDIFEVAVAEGELTRVANDLYLHSDHEADMRRRLSAKLAEGGPGLTVAEIRDLLGTTRKYAVPLCEYLDRAGITVRNGDLRVLAESSAPAAAK
jgi:selenocysteine-specific elongation factor